MSQGGLQFQAAPAHVSQILAKQSDRNILRECHPGLVNLLFRNQHPARQYEGASAFPTGNKPLLDHQGINSDSRGRCHPFESIMLLTEGRNCRFVFVSVSLPIDNTDW
jgi:hypothetical protein